jgi:hypothetical protein
MKITETASPAPTPERAGVPANHWSAVVCVLVVMGVAAHLAFLPPAPDVEDSILFVRGVIRYSVAEMRPHWPGYPVYIWVGKLITSLVGDPLFALHLVSAVASALSAWPLAFVTRAWAISLGAEESRANWCGWTTAALWLVTPMALVTGSQIVSDPLGLLCGATMLAWCIAGRPRGGRASVAAGLLGGLMIGVRLVNVTMLGPLVAEGWRRRGERQRGISVPLVLLLAVAAGVLPWLLWMALRDPAALFQEASSHLRGHFHRWGESVWTDQHPLTRPLRALRTLAVSGLGAATWDGRGLTVSAAWLALLVLAARPFRSPSPVGRLVALWAGPHLFYVFVAHDVEYPRYLLTAVALLCVAGGLALIRPGRASAAAALVAVAGMAALSGPLALRQHRKPSLEIQVQRFVSWRSPAAVFVVDHPGVAFFLEAAEGDVLAIEAAAEDIPRRSAEWSAGRELFATDPPPQDPAGWVPVAHFCRDPRINPYLSRELWLFAPVASAAARTGLVDACDQR